MSQRSSCSDWCVRPPSWFTNGLFSNPSKFKKTLCISTRLWYFFLQVCFSAYFSSYNLKKGHSKNYRIHSLWLHLPNHRKKCLSYPFIASSQCQTNLPLYLWNILLWFRQHSGLLHHKKWTLCLESIHLLKSKFISNLGYWLTQSISNKSN